MNVVSFPDPPEKWKEVVVFWVEFLVTQGEGLLNKCQNCISHPVLTALTAAQYHLQSSIRPQSLSGQPNKLPGKFILPPIQFKIWQYAHNYNDLSPQTREQWPYPMWQEKLLRILNPLFHMARVGGSGHDKWNGPRLSSEDEAVTKTYVSDCNHRSHRRGSPTSMECLESVSHDGRLPYKLPTKSLPKCFHSQRLKGRI